MDFDEFFDRLEKWEEETEEEKRRKTITTILRSKPCAYKDAIVKSALDRLVWYFENETFGIISVCGVKNSKKKIFDMQLKLLLRLRKQKLHCIPHLGFWDRIDTRCLFIPQISRNRIGILAKVLKSKAFIWGEKRNWTCCRTCNHNIVFKDNKLRVVDIDIDFLFYSRIIAQKDRYLIMMDSHKKSSNASNRHKVKTFLHIQNKINDLKKIEDELLR